MATTYRRRIDPEDELSITPTSQSARGRTGARASPIAPPNVNDCVLTGPEHAHLSDAEILAEALSEARRAEILVETE